MTILFDLDGTAFLRCISILRWRADCQRAPVHRAADTLYTETPTAKAAMLSALPFPALNGEACRVRGQRIVKGALMSKCARIKRADD